MKPLLMCCLHRTLEIESPIETASFCLPFFLSPHERVLLCIIMQNYLAKELYSILQVVTAGGFFDGLLKLTVRITLTLK